MYTRASEGGLPLVTYAPRERGVNSPIHFYCVLHAKRGEGVQIAFKIVYVLNGRPYVRNNQTANKGKLHVKFRVFGVSND